MRWKYLAVAACGFLLVMAATQLDAAARRTVQGGDTEGLFRHVGTFDVIEGNGSAVSPTPSPSPPTGSGRRS